MPNKNTYEWFELIPEVDPDPDGERELKDVVVNVVGRMIGTDGLNKATADARVRLPEPDPATFVEHKDLTAEWCEVICEAANGEFFREVIDRQLVAIRKRPQAKLFPSQIPAQEPEPAPSE